MLRHWHEGDEYTVGLEVGATAMTEDTQEVVEDVDALLQEALQHANTYVQHDEIRPSATLAFDKVEEARIKLDEIDNREFNDD